MAIYTFPGSEICSQRAILIQQSARPSWSGTHPTFWCFDFYILASIASDQYPTQNPMTPEERIRMNELCARIQEEGNYQNFAALLREMSSLIERKEQRRFPDQPKIAWVRNKPWTSMTATANKILSSIGGPQRKVEISIAVADDLFREIRIENRLMGVDGNPVELTKGAQLTVTFEADNSTIPAAS